MSMCYIIPSGELCLWREVYPCKTIPQLLGDTLLDPNIKQAGQPVQLNAQHAYLQVALPMSFHRWDLSTPWCNYSPHLFKIQKIKVAGDFFAQHWQCLKQNGGISPWYRQTRILLSHHAWWGSILYCEREDARKEYPRIKTLQSLMLQPSSRAVFGSHPGGHWWV